MKILQRSIALGALVAVAAVGAPAIGATSPHPRSHAKGRVTKANADPQNPDSFTYLGGLTSAGATDSSGRGNAGLVSTASGGTVTVGTDATYGAVLRFPQTTCAATGNANASCPRATISPSDQATLNPLGGTGDFAFGATVRMSTVAGKAGMNIIQRGVFGDGQAQWKLQTDYKGADGFRVASCRFSDGSTAVIVTGTKKLTAGTWYDLACRRSGSTYSLVVDQANGAAADETVTSSASLGSIAPTKPATIGGKAIAATVGQTDTATDQFHGDLDGVFFRRIAG